MRDQRLDPEETLNLIKKLEELKLLDELGFKGMHQFGGSLSGFRRYCQTVKSFRRNGENHRLHVELQKRLDVHEGR